MEFGVPALQVKEGRVVVSSRDVASVFGKQHDHVLRDVDALLAHAPDLGDVMFQVVSSPHPTVTGRSIRSFEMNRDGFTLLAMGYTGPKALQFKLAYIRRFNEMEEALRAPPVLSLPASPKASGFTLADIDKRVDERLAQVALGMLTLLSPTTAREGLTLSVGQEPEECPRVGNSIETFRAARAYRKRKQYALPEWFAVREMAAAGHTQETIARKFDIGLTTVGSIVAMTVPPARLRKV